MADDFSSVSIEVPLVRNANRLEAYSDALFSIIATIMVLPIAHTEIPEDEALTSSLYRLILPKLAVYMYTFIMISAIWTEHVRIFDIIEKVDEFSVLVNLAMMMTVTFFPFAFTLLGEYTEERLAVQIFAGAVIILTSIRFLLLWHVFSHPKMLSNDILLAGEQDAEKKRLYLSTITPFIISVLAFLTAFFAVGLALFFIALVPFGNFIRRYVLHVFSKCCRRGIEQLNLPQSQPFARRLLTETISKERIEFFSDGIFAIVATLIILDICEKSIPSKEAVDKKGGLAAALYSEGHIYLAYAGAFVTVAMQWYVHHSMLHYVKKVSKIMMIFNFMCLMFIGLSPMSFILTTTFDKHEGDNNEMLAIQVNSAVIFFCGLCQCCFWIAGLYDEQKLLQPAGHHLGRDHLYMTAKVFVYPIICLVTFFSSLISNFKVTIFVIVQICAVVIFVLLGLLFTRLRKWSSNRTSHLVGNDEVSFHQDADSLNDSLSQA